MRRSVAKRKRTKRTQVPDLTRRNRALKATQDKFKLQDFQLGKVDCVQLVRFHLVKMGHQNLPKATGYSSPGGMKKVLQDLGVENLEQLFDKLLPRIAPAAMLPGDIGLVMAEPGAPAWRAGTVVISVGRKFLGWHPDHPMLAILEPKVDSPFIAAWRA